MSLAEDVRHDSRTNPSTCQKIKYSNRNDTPGSSLTSDHRWSANQARLLAPHRAARGLRVPARNALLADVVPAHAYGRAYGFERTMDNLGAIVGPLLALGLVALVGVRTAILISIIPGLLAALAIVYAIKKTALPTVAARKKLRFPIRPVLRGPLGRVMAGFIASRSATSPPPCSSCAPPTSSPRARGRRRHADRDRVVRALQRRRHDHLVPRGRAFGQARAARAAAGHRGGRRRVPRLLRLVRHVRPAGPGPRRRLRAGRSRHRLRRNRRTRRARCPGSRSPGRWSRSRSQPESRSPPAKSATTAPVSPSCWPGSRSRAADGRVDRGHWQLRRRARPRRRRCRSDCRRMRAAQPQGPSRKGQVRHHRCAPGRGERATCPAARRGRAAGWRRHACGGSAVVGVR